MTVFTRILFFVFLVSNFANELVSCGEPPAIWTASIEKLSPSLCNENGVYLGHENMSKIKDVESSLDKVFPDKLKGNYGEFFQFIKYFDNENNLIYTALFTNDTLKAILLEKPVYNIEDSKYIAENIVSRIVDNFNWAATRNIRIKTFEPENGTYVEAIRSVEFYRYALKSNENIVLWHFITNSTAIYFAVENTDVFNRLIQALGGGEENPGNNLDK